MPLKIGFSEIDITPDKKVSLYGQFAERISEYVEKPITATAMAVESGNEQMVVVSCDLVCISHDILKAVRNELKGNDFGLDAKKIIIAATHIHTGYYYKPLTDKDTKSGLEAHKNNLIALLKPGQKYIEKENVSANPDVATEAENFDFLLGKLTKVITDAWNARKNGGFVNAFGRAVVGMCRRAQYNDDTAQMWGDTNTAVFEALEGGNDSGVELMYVFDESKKLTGVVANLACPAQCVQHRLFVSPDFWGEVKVRIREYFGEDVFLLPLCSAAGDQCPVDLIRWVEPYTDINDPNCKRVNPPKRKADPSMFDLDGMKKAGKRVANEIKEVWEEGLDEIQTEAVFEHKVIDMKLPIRRASLTDVENAKMGIRDYLAALDRDVDYNDAAMMQRYTGVLDRFEMQEKNDVISTEIHIIRLGNIAIATNPFELFLDYGNQIKARSDAEQTFLVQLANGSQGYLPTEKAEKHGHYSAFIASGKVGHVGGEQLVRETLQNIREMFSK